MNEPKVYATETSIIVSDLRAEVNRLEAKLTRLEEDNNILREPWDGLHEFVQSRKLGHGGENVDELIMGYAERLEAAVEAGKDMMQLAVGLDDDDPWYGERRDAEKRIDKARKAFAVLAAVRGGGE